MWAPVCAKCDNHSASMTSLPTSELGTTTAKAGAIRVAFLFALFFLIAAGLGYPVLNRYDPRQVPGLSDVKAYAEIVTGDANAAAVQDLPTSHLRFRVLVPWVARAIYGFARGRIGTWDPVMFSLLAVDSGFVAATAVLIVLLGARHLRNPAVGMVGAFLYLVNFAVPNLRLAGLVDAGEGFFLLALLGTLAECRLWPLPMVAVLGTLTKESFVPFSIALGIGWWLAARHEAGSAEARLLPAAERALLKLAAWMAIALAASLATFLGLHRAIERAFVSPLEFGLGLQRGHDYVTHFVASLGDRQLWYIFAWLLPTSIPRLKRLPRPWLWATAAVCAAVFALDAFYGGAPGTVGRALFTAAGPVLSLASAALLVGMFS